MSNTDDFRTALVNEVILRLYDESLPRILKCIDQLSDEQIWWRPNENSNSIGNLVLHLSGNVRQWICTGLGNYADNRKRQTEFDERGPISKDELKSKLSSAMEDAKSIITNVPIEELLKPRPVQTFDETGLTILIHVTEHFSYHTGQIAYITKMISDRQLGFYDGISLV